MVGAFLPYLGNLVFLALFALLGLALRQIAREQKPAQAKPAAAPELEPQCFAPAARLERVLAPRVERRLVSRPVAVERRGAGAPPAESAPGETTERQDAGEAVIARLVPQVPIRRDAPARSWFGGAPEMPAAMPWPKFSGRRGLFLAQICCADLPEKLWFGRGPRRGWLAIFVDPNDGRELRALHFAERGAPRPAPAPGACCTWPHAGGLDGEGLRRIDAFPRWPLDIVAVGPACADPRAEGDVGAARHGFLRAGFDLASPQHHPFDWASALALPEMAIAAMARRRALIRSALPDVQKQLANARKQIELGGLTQATLKEMERRAEELPMLVDGWKASVHSFDAASDQLRALAENLRARAESEPFTPAIAAELMAQLRGIELIHVERAPDPERGPGAENVRVTCLPLTEHHPDASLFAHDYEVLREDWAKHAYVADGDVFTDAQRDHFEARWRALAAHEMAGLGHMPFRDIPGFNPETQAVLVEFVSSALLKWRFGDDGSLAATIDELALGQSDFTRLRSQISQ